MNSDAEVEARVWAAWWRRDGKRSVSLLLWALWDPVGYSPPLDEYDDYADRVGSLLRRRASSDEIVGSLRDWRRELGVRPDDSADEAAGSKIGAWYGWVVGEFAEDDSFLESAD